MRFAALLLCAAAALAQSRPPGAPAPKPASRPAPAPRPAAPSYKDLRYTGRRTPLLPAIKRFQLANGMKVLLAEDHETPLIHGTAILRTGSAFDPPGKEGLASLMLALLRGGGTREHSPEQFDDGLDRLGATMDSAVGETMGTVNVTAWKANLAPTLALFAEALTNPAFRSDRLDLAKSATFNAIARRDDDTMQVMRREFLTLLQGRESALSRRPEYAGVASVQRGDLVRFYRERGGPANTLLVFSGDFETEAMRGALEALFSGWKVAPSSAPELPALRLEASAGTYLAFKPDAQQTMLAFGRPGLTYRDSDAAALEVAAQLLHRRLRRRASASADSTREMRVDSVPGLPYAGAFVVAGSFSSGGAAESVTATVEELQKLRASEPQDEEVRIAREAVWNRVCGGLDNRATAAVAIATAEYYGLPADYLTGYLQAVGAVTRGDVLRVAKARLDPATFTLLVVSNSRAFLDPRSGTAATPVDLTVPVRPPAPTASASSEDAKKLLARAQQASGGVERLAAVKDMTVKTVHVLARGGTDEEVDQWVAPSTLRQDGVSSQFGRLIRFNDGTGGWISNGYNSGALVGPTWRQAISDAMLHPISLLLSDRMPGRVLRSIDDDTIEIVQGGVSVRVEFDASTGLPSQLSYDLPTDRQPTLLRQTLSNYRDVNGIKLPFHVVTTQNGQKFAEGDVAEIKLNQGLKPEVLQRRP